MAGWQSTGYISSAMNSPAVSTAMLTMHSIDLMASGTLFTNQSHDVCFMKSRQLLVALSTTGQSSTSPHLPRDHRALLPPSVTSCYILYSLRHLTAPYLNRPSLPQNSQRQFSSLVVCQCYHLGCLANPCKTGFLGLPLTNAAVLPLDVCDRCSAAWRATHRHAPSSASRSPPPAPPYPAAYRSCWCSRSGQHSEALTGMGE